MKPEIINEFLNENKIETTGISHEDELTDAAVYINDKLHVQISGDTMILWKQLTGGRQKVIAESTNSYDILNAIKSTEERKMTIKEMLVELNECREALGMNPLKAWKESKDKLEMKINELHNELDERDGDDELNEEARLAAAADANDELEEEAALAGDDEPVTVRKATPKDERGDKAITFSLADIARELDMRPQTARAKFRRIHKRDENAPRPIEEGKWEFDAKHRKEVIKLMKG